MFPCTVSQLLSIISGSGQSADMDGHELVTGISIDSRSVRPGDAFFALPGERSHGFLFADDAVAAGASCVVAESSASEQKSDYLQVARFQPADTIETDHRIIRVRNVLQALQQFAAWNRQQSSALMIGVTGSVGKTTTRQMIAAVLNAQYCGLQSPRNFNNELGVPLSLLQLAPEHDFAVLEMGAGRPGDIAQLASLTQPEFGVITRVAAAHLESFGSMEAIRLTKQELPQAVSKTGTVFLNADDPNVRSMASATEAHVVLFGLAEDADIRPTDFVSDGGLCTMSVDGTNFQFHGPRQLLTSALAAIAVGRTVGVSEAKIAAGLATFVPDAGRGRVVQNVPWTVIDDSYNASPASVQSAIAELSDWRKPGHRILVLGDMLELGSEAQAAHFQIGQALMSSAVDHTLVFGEYAESVAAGARSTGVTINHISVFNDLTMLQTMLDCLLTPGDVVLIKGSRGMQMERVVHWLKEQYSSGPQRSAA